MKKLLFALLVCINFLSSQGNPRLDFPGLKAQYYDEPGGVIEWYYDGSLPNDLSKLGGNATAARNEIREEIANAVAVWDQYISSEYYPDNITFQEGDEGAKIHISFVDMEQSWQLGNTVPEDGETEATGVRSFIDINKNLVLWYSNDYGTPTGGRYLQSTLVHEIGHAVLGAFGSTAHSTNSSSVMYATYNSTTLITYLSEPYDQMIARETYNFVYFQFNTSQPTDYVKFRDPRVVPKPGSQPGYIQLYNGYQIHRSYRDENLLEGDLIPVGSGYRTVIKWEDDVAGTIRSTQHQFTILSSRDISADIQNAYQYTFQPAQFIESGGPTDYYNYIVNQNTIQAANNVQYYPWDNSVSITAQAPSGYQFCYWSDGSISNPYVLPATANKTLYAVYKKHLASNSTAALSSNNQRKVLRDVNNIYHAVYESAGKIFYTSSTDAGATWTNEVYVSSGADMPGYISRNPAIDLYYDNSTLTWKPAVVWEMRASDNSEFTLYGRRIKGSAWAGIEEVTPSNSFETTADGTPSLAYPYVLFRNTDGLYITRCTGINQDGTGIWSGTISQVPSTTSSSQNPSALYDPWKGTYLLHLAWDDNASLYYRNMTYSSGYQWSSSETVASGVEEISNTSPSIGMDNAGYIWIGWKYLNTEVINSNRIKVRKRLAANSYGTISAFGSGSGNPVFHSPSVSGNRQKPGNNDLSVAWHKSTSEVQKVSYVNGAWGSISTLSTSNQTPQLVFNETAVPFTNKIGFSRSTSGSVYVLTPISFSEGGGMQKSSDHTAAQQYTRGVITSLDQIEYNIEFGSIQLKQPGAEPRMIALATLPDTIPVNTIEEITSYLKSEPFIAYEQSELSLQLQEYPLAGKTVELNGKDIAYKLEFVENKTNNVLYTMHVSHLSERTKTIDVLPYRFGVTGNKEVYVRLSIVPQGDAQPSFTAVNEYSDESESGLNKSGTKGNPVVIDFIPKDFSLAQNYPNPFNPMTTITYDIAKDEFVTLSVYDAVGREVEKLVSEHKSPGRYTVQFNASRLSSGLYFYTMTAGKFKATQKMMLVK